MTERRTFSSEPPPDVGVEAALEQAEGRYRALFEQSPIGVFTFDRQRCITDCNLALVRLLRSSYEKLVGLDLRVLENVALLEAVDRVLDGEPLYFEGSYKAKLSDADVHMATWLTPMRDPSGEVAGGMGLIEDVTARREAVRALARSEANFRALIERAPDAVGVFRADGKHLYVNPKLSEYLGYERETFIRKTVAELLHPDDRAMFADRNRRRERGEALKPVEYRLLHRDGRVLYAEITSMRVEFDGGPAVLVMMRDLTERRKMQAQLLLTDRLASVGVLAAGIAHEINNPLAYVMTNLEVLSKKELPEILAGAVDGAQRQRLEQVAEMVEQARDGAERVRRIVRDVKIFARGGDEAREPIDVHACLDAAMQLVGHDLRRRARLVRDFAPVPKVHASESRLGQVFLNLLVNALQALPEGSAGEVIARVAAPHDAAVVVEIIDNGVGIEPEALSRVFDPFYTTKPVGVGTGLGLFVCQGIVASLDGALTIDSVVGRGTTVRVTLPTTPADTRSPSGFPPGEASGPPRSRVLVIDDEASIRRALAAAFADEHDVVTAQSGAAALDLLATDGAFDVVLCDLMMPDVSGIEVWNRILADRPELADRFVFVTGGAFTAETAAFLDSGRPYLDKPFDMPKLRALLHQRARRSGAGG